jgi:hypothetical protein
MLTTVGQQMTTGLGKRRATANEARRGAELARGEHTDKWWLQVSNLEFDVSGCERM